VKEGRQNHDGFPFRQYMDTPLRRPPGHGEGFAARRTG